MGSFVVMKQVIVHNARRFLALLIYFPVQIRHDQMEYAVLHDVLTAVIVMVSIGRHNDVFISPRNAFYSASPSGLP